MYLLEQQAYLNDGEIVWFIEYESVLKDHLRDVIAPERFTRELFFNQKGPELDSLFITKIHEGLEHSIAHNDIKMTQLLFDRVRSEEAIVKYFNLAVRKAKMRALETLYSEIFLLSPKDRITLLAQACEEARQQGTKEIARWIHERQDELLSSDQLPQELRSSDRLPPISDLLADASHSLFLH